MVASTNVTEAVGAVAEKSRGGLSHVPHMEADPYADVVAELAVDEFKSDLPFFPEKSGAELIPSILRPPASLSAAFGRMYQDMYGESQFRNKLEAFIDSVSPTIEAGDYLVRWNNLIRAFTEKTFVVRALLEAALASDTLIFDHAAAKELRQMEMMMDVAREAFQDRIDIEGDLRKSWPFNFVGMQLERINQPMNMLNFYPRLLESSDKAKIKHWRATAIGELKRLTDPLTHLRGVSNTEDIETSPTTKLSLGLPEGEIDLFVAHPTQDTIDFEAVRNNARSFFYLRTALEEIVLVAGRDRSMEIELAYSPTMGALLIKDKLPTVHGALWPFATARPRERIWDLLNRMGPGAMLELKGAETELNGVPVKYTVSTMVLELPDELVPGRKKTFKEAKGEIVATEAGPSKTSSTDDSGRFPMKTVFAMEEGTAEPVPAEPVAAAEAAPILRAPVHEAGTNPLEDIFAEIDEEAGVAVPATAEETAAIAGQRAANMSAAAAFQIIKPVLLKT